MLYKICYVSYKTSVVLRYITYVMLCHITYAMLCYITCVKCYVIYHMLYDTRYVI